MKNIEVENIRAEIERQKALLPTVGESNLIAETYIPVRDVLDNLLRFIDTHSKDKERVCGTCAIWKEGTLDRGICQNGEPHQTHSADTCENWKGED